MKWLVKYNLPEEYKNRIEEFRLQKINNGDWIDLRNSIPMDLKANQFYTIPLGVAMKLPPHCEAYIIPRSSTLKTYGLIGIFGLIDNSYCGSNDTWHFQAYATRDVHLEFGTRICQFRVNENMIFPRFDEVEELESEDRGGFGTTGVR